METISIIKIIIVFIVIALNIFILYAFHLATNHYVDYYKYMCIIGVILMIVNLVILYFIIRFNQQKQFICCDKNPPSKLHFIDISAETAYSFLPHEIDSQNYTIL